MERITTYQNNNAIQRAHSCIPDSILNRLHFDYFTNTDPIYAGLFTGEDTGDGRSYRNCACVMYPYHFNCSSQNKTTIVIPEIIPWQYVVHEIGHVLDEYLGFSVNAVPVSKYARRNRQEAFAEAFTAWLIYGYAETPCKTTSKIDEKTYCLLESL